MCDVTSAFIEDLQQRQLRCLPVHHLMQNLDAEIYSLSHCEFLKRSISTFIFTTRSLVKIQNTDFGACPISAHLVWDACELKLTRQWISPRGDYECMRSV